MSGETEREISGWTVDTLRDHIYALLAEQEKRQQERYQAQERAVVTALENVNVRLAGMNEWRQTVGDVLAKSMPRAETESLMKGVMERVNDLQARQDRAEGSGRGMKDLYGWIVAGVTVAISLVSVWWRK